MPWNGSGTFVRAHDWSADRDAGGSSAIIDADKMDEEFDNFKAGLEKCVTRDGQNNPSADLPMGGQKHTGVGNAAARDQYAAAGQVQDQSFTHVATVGGTADTITLTPTLAISAYAAGHQFSFVASGANTGAVTVNVSGLGAKNLTKEGTVALAAGDIASGAVVRIQYDGTQFQLVSPSATNGDVLGPASATDDRIAAFDGTSGKLLKDGGKLIADLQDDVVTTRGDVVRGGSAGTAERLALGSANQVLKSDGTDAAWANETPITTRGDIVRGGSTGVAERLGVGTNGQVLTSDGTDVTWSDASAGQPLITNVLAPHKGLVVKYVSATTVDIDATAVVLTNSSNVQVTASSVNLTADITTSGANGLDTGSEASSTWYHIWVIFNGSTVAALLSTSSTAPTMPSGYTYKGYVGAIYNNSSSNFDNIHQMGSRFVIPKVNVLTDGSATTYTALSLTSVVPPTAISVCGEGQVRDASSPFVYEILYLASDSGGLGEVGGRTMNNTTSSGFLFPFPDLIMKTAQTMYYKIAGIGGSGSVSVSGGCY